MGLSDIARRNAARNARAIDLAPGKASRYADGFNLFKPSTWVSNNSGPGPAPMYGGSAQSSVDDWNQYNNQARAQSTAAAPVANYGAANSTLGQAQGEIGNADSAMGQEQNATNLLESAANGNQPSVAQVQMGQGISAGLRAQLAGAASARGGAYADSAAQQAAAGANEQATAGAVSSSAALRAQEMENARTAYSSATQGMQTGDLAASGAEGNIASAQQAQGLSQAQLQAQQNALNVQGALGNDQLAQNIDTANLGAASGNQSLQAGANSQNAGWGQQLMGKTFGVVGGVTGGVGGTVANAFSDLDLGADKRRKFADGDMGGDVGGSAAGPGAGALPGGMGGLAAAPAPVLAPTFASTNPGGAGLDAGTAGDYAQGLGAAGGAASPRGLTKADAMKILGGGLQGAGAALGGGIAPAPAGTPGAPAAKGKPNPLAGVAGALSAPMQAPVLAPAESFRASPYSMGTPVHAGMVSPVGPATGRVADLDLRAIAAGAFGPRGSAADQNSFDLNLPFAPGFRAADADFEEPSGVKPPGKEAHWTMREEPKFIAAANQLTGGLYKLVTKKLTPAEKKEVLAPHGAGPIFSEGPDRQRTEVHDMQMGASPGYGLGAGASMNPMSALAQFSQNATAYGRQGGATGPGAAVGQQYADADLTPAPTHKVERARAPFQFDHDADEIYRPVPGDIAGGTERDRKLPAPAIKAADLDFRALTKTQYADGDLTAPPMAVAYPNAYRQGLVSGMQVPQLVPLEQAPPAMPAAVREPTSFMRLDTAAPAYVPIARAGIREPISFERIREVPTVDPDADNASSTQYVESWKPPPPTLEERKAAGLASLAGVRRAALPKAGPALAQAEQEFAPSAAPAAVAQGARPAAALRPRWTDADVSRLLASLGHR